jgi:hypothetical protein
MAEVRRPDRADETSATTTMRTTATAMPTFQEKE